MWDEDNTMGISSRKLVTLALSIMLISGIGLVWGSAPSDEINVQVDGDFIISFDDNYYAINPDIEITPETPATRDNKFAGSVHAVWYEINRDTGLSEIHYSMSLPESHGSEWSNDEDFEDDRIISQIDKSGSSGGDMPFEAMAGDAVDPSLTIDSNGHIHVIWSELYQDNTWEVLYTRSEDNGLSWIPIDIPVSDRRGEGDAPAVSEPTIAMSLSEDGKSDIIHATWSEMNNKGDGQEIFYSQSVDGGNTWSGAAQGDMMISSSDSRDFAYDPVIATSGVDGRFVHVAWFQVDEATGANEIMYARSPSFGQEGWEYESFISRRGEEMPVIRSIDMTAYGDDVHVVWSQGTVKDGLALEIYYSGSIGKNGDPGSWLGVENDWPVSFADGNPVSDVSIAVGSHRDVNVVWSELDDESKTLSKEVHMSSAEEGSLPEYWTGMEKDNVVSWPDPEAKADVSNVTVVMGPNIDGVWKTHIVWEEPNVQSATGYSTSGHPNAADNHEIHYIPEKFTLSVSVDGSGSVTKDPNSSNYNFDDPVTLTAIPSDGWKFVSWTGSLNSDANPVVIKMSADKNIVAHFVPITYTLSVSVSPGGTGSVTKNPNQSSYNSGTIVQLTANPIPGYEFDHWEGSLTGSTNPVSITMNTNKVITAYFTQITANVKVYAGWNFISVPLVPLDTTTANVLDDSAGDGLTTWDIVYKYDAADADDQWKINIAAAPTLSDLANIDHEDGLWIHITNTGDGNLTFTGTRPTSTAITLRAGWNLIGYPANDDDAGYDVGDLKLDTGATIVESYDKGGTYLLQEMSNAYVLKKGEAYWIRVPSQTIWTVNW